MINIRKIAFVGIVEVFLTRCWNSPAARFKILRKHLAIKDVVCDKGRDSRSYQQLASPPSAKLLYLSRNYIQTTHVRARKLNSDAFLKKLQSSWKLRPLETLNNFLPFFFLIEIENGKAINANIC